MPKMAENIIRENIERLMKRRGWSQMDLVKAAGIDQGRLSHILDGSSTQLLLPMLMKLTKGFNVTLGQIVYSP